MIDRFADDFEILFWDPPLDSEPGYGLSLERRRDRACRVEILTPRLPAGLDGAARVTVLEHLLRECGLAARTLVRWYRTPLMLPFSRRLEAVCTVYERMERSEAQDRAGPGLSDLEPGLLDLERELLAIADMVVDAGEAPALDPRRLRDPFAAPRPGEIFPLASADRLFSGPDLSAQSGACPSAVDARRPSALRP